MKFPRKKKMEAFMNKTDRTPFFLNEPGRRAADYIKKKKQHPDWTKQQRQRNRPVGFGHGHSNSTRTLLNKQPIGLGHQRGRTTPLDETRNNQKQQRPKSSTQD